MGDQDRALYSEDRDGRALRVLFSVGSPNYGWQRAGGCERNERPRGGSETRQCDRFWMLGLCALFPHPVLSDVLTHSRTLHSEREDLEALRAVAFLEDLGLIVLTSLGDRVRYNHS